MFLHEIYLRVRYAETDQMGVVYHANYLIWMEMGRVETFRALGFRYRDMEAKDGVMMAVAEVTCRYLLPARYDEEIAVRTRVIQAASRMVTFGYEIAERETGSLLARGETKHIFVDKHLHPTRLPVRYQQLFQDVASRSSKTHAHSSAGM